MASAEEQQLLQHGKLEESGLQVGNPVEQRTHACPPAVLPKPKKTVPDHLVSFLSKLGLLELYPNKLTLKSLLEISHETVSDKAVQSLQEVPLAFLRKLLMVNANCRSYTCEKSQDNDDSDEEDDEVNPLDLVTALYLCADSFLQQEMAIKMSMCQFAVPFLLPQFDDSRCSLMVWALRNIYKEWRPHVLDSKSHVEDSVVHAQIPLITFVRLKDCSLSKSQLLNHVISNAQQSVHFFTHKEMQGGNIPKEIADGLVELAWCLPCGQSNTDVFPQPVAIANMRGDVITNHKQFSFLMQVSTAVFVCMDTMTEEEEKLLDLQGALKSKLFLVINSNLERHQVDSLKLPENHMLTKKRKVNMAKFSGQIIGAMKTVLGECKETINIEKMSDIAGNLGISVDETKSKASRSAKTAANDLMKGIGVRHIADYKDKEMPLQGKYLKEIAEIEREECRLQNAGDVSLEKYKAELHEKKCSLRELQRNKKTSQAMESFIQALCTTDKEQRTFFLKWMALKLDQKSHNHLTELRQKFKEQCHRKDNKFIAELDQQLLQNSLGIEHYMREIGQMYESKQLDVTRHLPSIAAELLLDGYPIELLDGDTSIIPEKWVTDVLMEVHRKVGSSRLLVVSVLGVQSTGKSTLLNTMFGVQFPVSSGRCTRGAYMLFLSVDQELRQELKCDFILLIDTEGLKSPELAGLDDSYEHDNQLATLVIGLSDVTIINIAMENSTEMKDILQIAVHAFLRMKQLGKKPACHFVHQNVAGVSAHSKLLTERKHLLEQLDMMTQCAADMENQSEVKKFTDVLDYDIEKNNWYVPGLWHGTPPMAPVNSGYSDAVHEFKKSLLKSKHTEDVSAIPDFLKWMSSLWKAVRHENFIFSFRNTLVAYAYDSLCKEFSDWEWSFRKSVYSWLNIAETQISNINTSQVVTLKDNLELESKKVVAAEIVTMNKNLTEYYKRKDRNVHLVGRYRAEFQISVKSLGQEMTHFLKDKLQSAVCLKMDKERVEKIQSQHTAVIEKQVVELLKTCKESSRELSDDDLGKEFEKMWSDVTKGVSALEEKNISTLIRKQLQDNLSHRNVQEDLLQIEDLTKYGDEDFKVRKAHLTLSKKIVSVFVKNNIKSNIQHVANRIVDSCTTFIENMVVPNKDYQDNMSRDLLREIDELLKQTEKKTNTTFEVDLKVHICGIAARRFLEMHQIFLSKNNPRTNLERSKKQYLSDFIDSYRQRDQCLRKAKDFTQLCIKPSITEYINKSLGIEIVDGILASSHSSQYSSRSYFQYTILAELLEKDNFENLVQYIHRYERFVKKRILQKVVRWLSKDMGLVKLKGHILKTVMKKITDTIAVLRKDEIERATVFLEKLCHRLCNDISLPTSTMNSVLFQMSCRSDQFIDSLLQSLDDLREQLDKEFAETTNVKETLKALTVKPQDEIFLRVCGCGEQCPFCKIPCEAGGKAHTKHHATVHRPQGLAGYCHVDREVLVESLCTTCVFSSGTFGNADTQFQQHPFKEYHVHYPNWIIAPDPSVQASDYWKYVLVKYNDRFADNYEVKPAVCPEEWHSITKEQALEGLKAAFNVK